MKYIKEKERESERESSSTHDKLEGEKKQRIKVMNNNKGRPHLATTIKLCVVVCMRAVMYDLQ